MTTECPFCAIAAGTEPAEVVIDTGPLVAFLDNRPIRPATSRSYRARISRRSTRCLRPLPPKRSCLVSGWPGG